MSALRWEGGADGGKGAEVWLRRRAGWVWAAVGLAWLNGVWLGHLWADFWWWWLLAAMGLAACGWFHWRDRLTWARWAALIVLIGLGAAWSGWRVGYAVQDDVRQWVGEHRQLVEVTGRVLEAPRPTGGHEGAFADYRFQSGGGWTFDLAVQRLGGEGGRYRARGRLQVLMRGEAGGLAKGDGVRLVGWLEGVGGQRNPGGVDWAMHLARRGVHGQLTGVSGAQVERLGGGWVGGLVRARGALQARAARALDAGVAEGTRAQSLLHSLILGDRSAARELGLFEAFREVGVAHLLAISGAHMAVLVGLVWVVGRLVIPHPRAAGWLVLAVIGLYLLLLPARVPVLRAAIMAGVFAAGWSSGRAVSAMGLLGIAAALVLLWRPEELLSAGFQLSFGTVAGLILFLRPVSRWIWAGPTEGRRPWRRRDWLGRRGADIVAVNVVAWLVAFPVVVHHFQLISPYAVFWAIVVTPAFTLVLTAGFMKLLVGLLSPSLSGWLAWPATWSASWLAWCVETAHGLPGAAVYIGGTPGAWWALATAGVTAAVLGGWFAGRRLALGGCVLLISGWLVLGAWGVGWREHEGDLRVDVLDVGHGSAWVVRGGGAVLLWDAGSHDVAAVGRRTVLPALGALGVRRLDAVFISHGHFDHYSGMPAVLGAYEVDRVKMPASMAAGGGEPGALGLFHVLRREGGVEAKAIGRGWRGRFGEAMAVEALWPAADWRATNPNDRSLVLRVRVGDDRLLLSGDIERPAIEALLARARPSELEADVMELPHHGEHSEAAERLVKAVGPAVVIQSASSRQFERDGWGEWFERRGIERRVTAREGAVGVRIQNSKFKIQNEE